MEDDIGRADAPGRPRPARERRIALVAMALWLLRYVTRAGVPWGAGPRWNGYFDQAHYLRSAIAFSNLDLRASEHWYPLAYPLIVAPFVRLLPTDPFLVPDCLLFGLTAVAFVRVMRRFGIGAWAAATLFLATGLLVWPLAKLWVEPWTTTVSAALLWWLFALVAAIPGIRSPRVPDRWAVAVGALATALPLARPTDLLALAIVLPFAACALYRRGLLSVRTILCVAGGGAVPAIAYLALHVAIHGPHASDYARAAALQGFAFADLPWKLAVVVVSAKPWFPDGLSLLEGFPPLLPGMAGLVAAAPALAPPARRLLGLIALVALPYCAIFLAYTDLQPPGVWTFGNAHYFKWLFPLAGAGCWMLARALGDRRRRPLAVGALAALGLATCIRPVPVAVGDAAPARMLQFRGDTAGFWQAGRTTAAWDAAYFRPARIVDARGELVNVGRYHQVPDAAGERAIAVSRLFAANARRIDPADAPPFRGPQRPYARYAARASFGWPCWLARAACALPPPRAAAITPSP